MDKLASCCLRHGALPSSHNYSKPYNAERPTSLPHRPRRRRSIIPVVRCILTNPNTAKGRHSTKPRHADEFSSGFDFEQYLTAHAKSVHEALDRALALPARLEHEPDHHWLIESMRYSVLSGGKRVRPVLAIAACEFVGGDAAAAAPVACAVEMVHAMSLVHDEMPCMDDDALRRGRPSCHAAFGEHAALLAGDALLALAFEHLALGYADAGIVVPAERALRSVAEIANAAGIGGVAAGQLADKACEGRGSRVGVVSLATLEHVHVHKTARLLEAAAVSGAIVGGGTGAEVERVRRYARRVGLLFQVVDDVLDVTRTSVELGKTAGKDLVADKSTYPKLLGGVDKARAYADELLAMAEAELEGVDARRAAPLRQLARFVAYRQN